MYYVLKKRNVNKISDFVIFPPFLQDQLLREFYEYEVIVIPLNRVSL